MGLAVSLRIAYTALAAGGVRIFKVSNVWSDTRLPKNSLQKTSRWFKCFPLVPWHSFYRKQKLWPGLKETSNIAFNSLSKWPTWRTIILFYNKFITVIYMFRATSCSSSRGQILLIEHLVTSLSVSGRPVHNLCTGRSLTDSYDTRCCINTIWPPDDEHDVARNM